ncbi:hypothetical protein GGI10_002823 [Coemansia sp. RSA 2530]|nr:hypothetical protein GGI10_002823 [Coemansia sp. RSA 2530]
MDSSEPSAFSAPVDDMDQPKPSESDSMPTQPVQSSDGDADADDVRLPLVTPGPSSEGHMKIPSGVMSSSPSRVHGKKLLISMSQWLDLTEDHAILVDKSLAIKRIMENGARVMTAIAPRRSGKTTFLTMMSEFLSAHSTWTASERMKSFEQYNLCTQESEFFKDHFAKYPVIYLDFSNTANLKLGLMVGVFDVGLLALGSGLNNAILYQAHTGSWRPRADGNLFDTAFNLSAADMKGLVDLHVDLYVKDEAEDTRHALKTKVLRYCFEHFDGYHYGCKGFIFNTYCAVRFLSENKCRDSLSQLQPKCMRYWASTGSMAILRHLHTDDTASFMRLAGALVREYMMRHSYRYGNQSVAGALLEKLKLLDMDGGLDELESLQDTDFPVDLGAEELNTVASICTCESSVNSIFELESGGFTVDSVFRVLYQAGYLTPLKPGQVGIPNHEVLEDFIELSVRIHKTSGLPGLFNSYVLDRLGLGQGNVFVFSLYLDQVALQQPPAPSTKMAESIYHLYMHALLAPLIGLGGFSIDHEAATEGGRTDIRLRPALDNRSAAQPYIVLELKKLNHGTNARHEDAMTDQNLEAVAARALRMCNDAMTQIRQRYQNVSHHQAHGATMLLLIGITFWRYRFCLIARRLIPSNTTTAGVHWVPSPFTEEETLAHVTNNITFSVNGGDLVASNIFIG